MEAEQQVPPEIVFGAFGAGGLEVDEGSRYVSSSDEVKVIADRVRVGHRTGRVQVRDLVRVLETKSVTGRTPEIRAVREFFDWSVLFRNNSVKTLEEDRPAEFISTFSQREIGLERQGNVGKYLLLLSDYLTAQGKAHDSMSPISQRRRMSIAKLLETTAPNGGQDCFEHGCAQSRRCVGSCAHPDHVRNWNREEQEWRGGRCDQSQSKSTRVNRASSRGFLRRQDSPSDDAVFCEKSRNLVNPGKWSNARCDALTTSVLALSCQEPSTCAKRDTQTFCLDASGAQHQDQHQIGTKRVHQQ